MKNARFSTAEIHWPLVFTILAIAALGIYNLHSASAAMTSRLYLTQFYVLAFGVILSGALLAVDYRVSESFAYILYAVAMVLLMAVEAQGKVASGARRWLVIGPLTFQPSEIAKLAPILALARYFDRRVVPGGYTLSELFRPLNFSRPVGLMGALALSWKKPWIVDPVGELARFIRRALGAETPTPANLLWFRAGLVVLLVSGLLLGVALVLRTERERQLLDPWPKGRRNFYVGVCVAAFVFLGILLVWGWKLPLVRDPFGVAVAYLHDSAGVSGLHATLVPHLTLRLVVSLGVLVYLGACALHLRAGAPDLTDLLIAPIDLVALPALLVLIEPDLGSAALILVIGLSVILIVGVRLKSLMVMGFMGAMVVAVGWFGVLKDYQKRRISTFLDPEHDIKGAGWHAVQSMIAVGSGRWFGKGHREGTQSQLSFLPEQHTDFAFSVWAEEQGLLGCLLVLCLYLLLIVLIFNVARNARERYGALIATGVAMLILWQTFINVGMVIGALPVVGTTLPMFSYGGSSLLSILIGMALVLNVHLRRRTHG